jgi:uncharacterized protein
MLQFDLSPLIGARAGERLAFSLDEGPQTLDDVHIGFLRGRMSFTRVQSGILVEGQLETQVEAECIRCLEHLPCPMDLEVEEVIGLGGSPRSGITYRLTEEGWFDLSPLLREQVWVALPMKPLCGSDCRGICPECGTNLNLETCRCREERVDSRFAVLEELRR